MGPTTQSDEVIRFEGFELNPHTGELRKNDIRLNLQDQPFKVLVALLQHPGEMVGREELRQLIWPEESFGDFDHAINRSIAKLRSVLGDSPDVPHLIETLPRRGYRFIGSIEGHPKEADEGTPSQGAGIAALDSSPRAFSRWRTALTVAGSLFVAILALDLLARPFRQPRILKVTPLTHDGKPKCCVYTDGARIYFTSFEHGSYWRIKQIPVIGGDPTDVPMPSLEGGGDLLLSGLSRDNDRMLIDRSTAWDSHSLWSAPISGSSPRHLTDVTGLPGAFSARWSPDGQSLIYSTGHELILAHADGTEPQKIFSTKGVIEFPEWSPDSKRLRFVETESLASDRATLSEIPATGGEPREVTPPWKEKHSEGLGRWTSDGRYFIFFAGSNGRNDIWAIREHPTLFSFRKPEPVRLTSGPVLFGSLAFSPDGKKIFTRGVELRGEVERYDPKISQFVPLRPELSADCCVYSKDGQWMAYVTFPEGDLWRSKPDGTHRQQLTWPPLGALNPHWSPDGKEIAFSGSLPGKVLKTFIISAEGGEPRQLTQQNDCAELEANWSPDETHLTFGSYIPFSAPSCPTALFIMDLKTHEVSTIPGSNGLWAPRWSPDGRYIVAQEGPRRLMLYDLIRQKWSKLLEPTSPGETVGFPQWSTDAKVVYYRVWASGHDDGAYRIRLSDNKIEKIVNLSGIPTTGALGFWTAFDPNGNPIILRDLSLNEIYALDVDLP